MRIAAFVIVFVFVVASRVPAAGQTSVQTTSSAPAVTLAELESLALDNNPAMSAARADIEAARGRTTQAAKWPNPIAGYSGDELWAAGPPERGKQGFFVEQTIPLGGRRSRGRQVFERSADRAEALLDLQVQRVLGSVRILFYEALVAERRVEVQQRLAALARETVDVTAQLFNVGVADRSDYIASQIEARRAELALESAKNDVTATRHQLAAAVGRDDVAGRPFAGSIDEAIPVLERDAARRDILERSPELRAARAEVARSQAVTALARRQTAPDLFVRAGGVYDRERNEITGQSIGWEGKLETGVSVPLFDRNQGEITASRAEETRAQAEVRRLELALESEAAGEFATYLTSVRAADAYRREILPQAEEAHRLYLARYKEMAAAYPQVIAAQRTLFELSRDYLESVSRAWRSALLLQGYLAGDALRP
jgi:cobalt-zinc-cadmium efflux system outer membrane protein